MATLEEMAAYRPGVLSRLANVLTGGLSGAVTGQAERANEAAYARRALLSSQLEDAMMKRRQEELQRRIQEQYEFQAGLQAKQEQEREQRRLASLKEQQLAADIPFLRSRGVDVGEPDPETARMMAMQVSKEEEDKAKQRQTGMNLTLANGSQIYGTFDELQRLAQTNPMIKEALSNQAPRQRGAGPTLSATRDKDTGEMLWRIENIPAGMDPNEVSAMVENFMKLGGGSKLPTPPPSNAPTQPSAEPQSIGKYKVRIKQ